MKQNRLTKDQKEELFELYKTYKYTYKDLAEKFGKTVSSISCLLNREGLRGKRENNHFRKYDIDQNYFDLIDSEEKAYFLGFLCADGCNHNNSTKVSMFLKESDKDILVKLNNLLQPTKPLTYCKKKMGTNQYGMQISNKRISDSLNSLGCTPQKTFTLKLANECQVPPHLFNHYIRGFFDGDGWMGKKELSITSSEPFCQELTLYLLNTMNIETRNRFKGRVVEMCFRVRNTKQFLDWMYMDSTIYLERKYQRYLKYHKNKTI